jgi:two-component system response regulator AgrA
MNVFLLEDDILQQQRLEILIRDILLENKWLVQSITTTSRPKLLLKQIYETVSQNIYFLDIEINGEKRKGLEIAKKIREIDPHGVIAFITTHSEFAPITYAYKVSAYDFIDKNWQDNELKIHITSCLNALFDSQIAHDQDEMFFFENKHTSFQVPFSDILYFETTEISHKLRLICKSRLVNFYATLGEIEKIDPRFYQVHRSFVVNLINIVEIDRSEGLIYFSNKHSCMISRRKIKTVLNKIKRIHSI